MAELGVGVRVWVGWTNDVDPVVASARCHTGTITGGPRMPGDIVGGPGDFRRVHKKSWELMMDSGMFCAACEEILFPLDGDGTLESVEDAGLLTEREES